MNVWPTWPTRSIPATSSSATKFLVCAPAFSPSARAIPSRFLHRQASCWNGFLRFSFLSLPHPPPSSVCFRPLRLFPQEARMARAAARSWLASKSPPFPPEFTMMQFRWSLMEISPPTPPFPSPCCPFPRKSRSGRSRQVPRRVVALSFAIVPQGCWISGRHFRPQKSSLSPLKVIIFPLKPDHLETKTAVGTLSAPLKPPPRSRHSCSKS